MEQLNRGTIIEIACHLNFQDIYNLTLVSKRFSFIINDSVFWYRLLSCLPYKYYTPEYGGMQYTDKSNAKYECLKYFTLTTNDYIPGIYKILPIADCLPRMMKSNDINVIDFYLDSVDDDYITHRLYYNALKTGDWQIVNLSKDYIKNMEFPFGYKNYKRFQLLKFAARNGNAKQSEELYIEIDKVDFSEYINSKEKFLELLNCFTEVLSKSVKHGDLEFCKLIYTRTCESMQKYIKYYDEKHSHIHNVCDSISSCFLESPMLVAVLCPNVEIFYWLYENYCLSYFNCRKCIPEHEKFLEQLLSRTAIKGNWDLFDYVKCEGSLAFPPAIYTVVQYGREDLLRKMFVRSDDPEDDDPLDDFEPGAVSKLLEIAIKYNHLETLKYLIEIIYDLELNSKPIFNWAAELAVECGLLDIVKYLLLETKCIKYRFDKAPFPKIDNLLEIANNKHPEISY